MKSLKERIIESLLDDEDEVFDSVKENIIKEFLETNYKIRGSYTIKEIKNKFVVGIEGNVVVKNKNIAALTNDFFEFESIRAAADSVGVLSSNLSKYLNTNKIYNGYIWKRK